MKKKASRDRQLAQLSDRSALLFVLSIPHLDVEGRMIGLPALVRGTVVPEFARARPGDWTDEHVAALMFEWTTTTNAQGAIDPLALWYAVDGENVVVMTGFLRNQSLRRDREAPSRLPAPPPELLAQYGLVSADLAASATPGAKTEDRRENDLPTVVASDPARESLPIADSVEARPSAVSVTRSGFGDRPAGFGLQLDDLGLLASSLAGHDANTVKVLAKLKLRGCGEREFAMALESLQHRRARTDRRPLTSEVRYFVATLTTMLSERAGAAA